METKVFGPVQAHVTLFVADEPDKGKLGVVHVTVPAVAVAPGSSSSNTTIAVETAVQPLTGSATVRIYSPDTVITGSSSVEVKLFGPVQLSVTPGVVEPPSSVMVEILQSNVPPAALTFGTLASGATEAVAVVVQPLVGSVTVKV